MQAKSERFELRLDQVVIEHIDAWRAAKADMPSRSEAVRRLIEGGLGADSSSSPHPISAGERLGLALLADIHRAVVTKGEMDPNFIMSAIYGGHYWAFDWELQGLFHHNVDQDAVLKDVVDILDMWTFIEEAVENLTVNERNSITRPSTFVGFDGNNEPMYVGIARFLIDDMGRFSRFKGRDLNSHHQVVARYRKMLREFEPLRPHLIGRSLNVSELESILKA